MRFDLRLLGGHPRTSGTRGTAFRMAREGCAAHVHDCAGELLVGQASGRTGIEAMQERGRLQVGKASDVTLFDPVTITDNFRSKVGENGHPTTGIPCVAQERKRTTCNIAIFP